MPTKHSLLIAVLSERRALELHSESCTAWDFESNCDCAAYDDTNRRYRAALAKWRAYETGGK